MNRIPQVDTALVKALARAYRWQALLEEGTYSSIQELAAAEQINPSYVSRVLRLTLLAPNIVDAILDGKAEDTITLGSLMKPFSVEWKGQSGLELVRQ